MDRELGLSVLPYVVGNEHDGIERRNAMPAITAVIAAMGAGTCPRSAPEPSSRPD